VQPSEKLKYYPILDIFFNLQVKRTRLFFMMQHVNAGLIWDGYYATDAYPMPGRIFRGGVSWQFYD
jgi:outer membrane receptor protein involved in Fe transport